MRANPVWTSGTTRAEAALVAAVPGLLIKGGAEGVCAFALADGRAGAVKFDDGAQRAAPVIVAAVLAALTGHEAGVDRAALAAIARPPVTGGGVPVGELRLILPV